MMFLDHTTTIQLPSGSAVWQEHVSASSQRSYSTVQQPIAPPTALDSPSNQTPKSGLSLITFNADGTVLATRDDSTPTTVWIWDLKKLSAAAVLIQHSPIKQLLWHPTVSSLLLIQCSHDEPTFYFYDSLNAIPYTTTVPFQKSSGRLELKWLLTPADKKPAVLVGDLHSFMVSWPEGKDQILRFEQSEQNQAEENEEDSLFDILTGKTPVKPLPEDDFEAGMDADSTEMLVSDVLDETTVVMDDTFRGHRHFGVA
jgi:hypothetical protein